MSVLLVQLVAGVGEHSEGPLSPEAGGALVEAGDATRVVSLLDSESAGSVLVEPALGRVVEVTQIAEQALHSPAVRTVLLSRDRLNDFADETG